MNLGSVANGFWAITAEMHEVVLGILDRHMRGETPDLAALEAKLGRPMKNPAQDSTIHDGVCVIPVNGVLCKAGNMFTDISGASSMQMVSQQFADALADPAVHSIVLSVDSPGGTVDGTQALADQIFAARGKKPMSACIDGMGASAAYWIASAADSVYLTSDTAQAGSIGVIARHTSTAAADAQRGLQHTIVASGPLKGAPHSHLPLDDSGRGILQHQVNTMHDVFKQSVARHRGLTGDRLNAVTDGRVLIGKEAIDAGLADGRANVQELIQRFKKGLPVDHQKYRAQAPVVDEGDLVLLARQYQREQRALGRRVTAHAAMAHVQGGNFT